MIGDDDEQSFMCLLAIIFGNISVEILCIFKKQFFAYLFIFGCAGSSLPQGLFSSCGEWLLLSSCGVWASHWGPSLVVKHGLWGTCAQQLQLPGSRARTW